MVLERGVAVVLWRAAADQVVHHLSVLLWKEALERCGRRVFPDHADELVHEQTPGGINEQVVRELTEAGAYRALDDTLDGILARIEGRPRPEKRKRPYESEAMD